MAMALRQVPAANVTWNETNIIQHHTSDVGVAVSVEGGLFTPVVRSAETKSLSAISNEMKYLAARARARKLQPAEYQGGTTAISNLGMFGIEQFTAIINPPHASILAVGEGIEKFVPVNGQPALRTQMVSTCRLITVLLMEQLGPSFYLHFAVLSKNPPRCWHSAWLIFCATGENSMRYDYTSMGFYTYDCLGWHFTEVPAGGGTVFIDEITLAVSGAGGTASIAAAKMGLKTLAVGV